ncbi:MAG: hypothetical protein V7L14_22585 [Nostoc sp.]|uniref:hypothetical protein n=1 Tax=Nostoc sp. TaxID=1180 RepID=UPI002FF68552
MTACPVSKLQFCNLSRESSGNIMAEGEAKYKGASINDYCVLIGFEPRPDYAVGDVSENAFSDLDGVLNA